MTIIWKPVFSTFWRKSTNQMRKENRRNTTPGIGTAFIQESDFSRKPIDWIAKLKYNAPQPCHGLKKMEEYLTP
jgi:hypothetical protein